MPLPADPDLADVFRAYPQGAPELLAFHDVVLRGESYHQRRIGVLSGGAP